MANGDDQNQGNQGGNPERGREDDRAERQGDTPDFSELSDSILGFATRLENSINQQLERLDTLNEHLNGYIFTDQFAANLEQNLNKITKQNETLTEKIQSDIEAKRELSGQISQSFGAGGGLNVVAELSDEAILGELHQIGTKIDRLGDSISISPEELEHGAKTGTSQGVSDLSESLSQFSPQMAQLVQGLTAFMGARMGAGRSSPRSGREAGDTTAGGGGFDPSSLFGERIFAEDFRVTDFFGDTDILEEFPEFIKLMNLAQSDLNSLDRMLNVSAESFEGVEQSVISFSDVYFDRLDGLERGSAEYIDVVSQMRSQFEETFGEHTRGVLGRFQSMIDQSTKALEAPGRFEGAEVLYESFFESVQEQAQDLQQALLRFNLTAEESSVFDNLDIDATEEMSKMILEMQSHYQQLVNRGASQKEISRSLLSFQERLNDKYGESIEKNEVFGKFMDQILGQERERLETIHSSWKAAESTMEVYRSISKPLDNIVSKYEKIRDAGLAWLNIIKSSKGSLVAIVPIIGGLLVSAATAVYNTMLELDSATQQVAEATGLIPERLYEAQEVIGNIAGPLIARGQDMNEIAGAVTAIYDNFQSTAIAAERFGAEGEDIVDQTSRLASVVGHVATSLNVSNDEAAQMIGTMQSLTSTTGKQLEDQLVIAKTLTRQAELAPKDVFQDISEASEQIAKFGAVTGEEIARAAVEARLFGSNLQEVLNIAEGLRGDITGTITGLQRAELMLGQPIDELKLLRASFQGPEASAKALRETITSLDLDLDGPLAAIQLEPLAETLGISIARMREMQETSRAARKSIGDLVVAGNLASLEEKFTDSQSEIQKFQNSLESAFFVLKQMIAGPVLEWANPYLKDLSEIIQSIHDWLGQADPTLQGVADKIRELGAEGDETKQRTAGFAASVVELVISLRDSIPKIKEFAKFVKEFAFTMIEAAKSVIKVTAALTPAIKALAPVLEFIGDAISWMFEGDWKGVATKVGLVTTAFFGLRKGLSLLGPAVSMLGGKLVGLGKNLLGKIPVLGKMAGKLTSVGGSVSTAAGAASKSTSVFKSFGVQLAAVAGSVFLISEAFQNFAELDWGGLAKGVTGLGVSLGGLVIAMRSMQGALTSMTASFPQMAGAALIIGTFAASVWGLSKAMENFAENGWDGIGVFLTLTAVLGGLTALLVGTGGIAGAAAGGVVAIMGAFAASLYGLSLAMLNFGEAAHSIIDASEKISKLRNVDQIANKVVKLSKALSQLPGAGLGEFLAGLTGTAMADQLNALTKLAGSAEGLDMVAVAISHIADAMAELAKIDASDAVSDLNALRSGGKEGMLESIGNFFGDIALDTITLGNADNVKMLADRFFGGDKEEFSDQISGLKNLNSEITRITKQLSSVKPNVPQAGPVRRTEEFIRFGEIDGSKVDPLIKLANKADEMRSVAKSVSSMAGAVHRLGSVDLSNSIHQLENFGSLENINGSEVVQPESTESSTSITPEPVETNTILEQPQIEVDDYSNDTEYKKRTLQNDQQLIEKLNQMVELQRNLVSSLQNGDIAVYLDGKDVTDQLLRSSKKQVARG